MMTLPPCPSRRPPSSLPSLSPLPLSLLWLSLLWLPPLSVSAQSVGASCDPGFPCPEPQLHWRADLDKVAEVFKTEASIESVEDLFRVEIATPGGTVVSATHLFPGSRVRLIPFHELDGQRDVGGAILERGDQEVASHFPNGEIGFAVKHKRIANRTLDLTQESPVTLLLDIKLMDSHLGIIVGVERDGQRGAVTLNNPQAYDGGSFGGAHSAQLFLAPEYPSYLSEAQRLAFRDNMRTMLVGLNAVSRFPLKFDGGDPLNGHDQRSVLELAATMIEAIAGDQEALEWFSRAENMLYCAELAHVGASAGLLAPLNERTFVPLVGRKTWLRFSSEVAAHNAGKPSAFTALNKNPQIRWIQLALADPDLEPATTYAPERGSDEPDTDELAFRPMTSSDMLVSFLDSYLPQRDGDETVARARAALLRGVRMPALGALGTFDLEPDDPRRLEVESLYGKLVEAVMQSGRAGTGPSALEPLLAELDALDLEEPVLDPGAHRPAAGLFVPPSLWHLQAQGRWSGGLLGLRYVGHGLHLSLLRRSESAAPLRQITTGPTEPTPLTVAPGSLLF